MKKILVFLFIASLSFAGKAQVMQAKTVWATVTVPQMKCWECKNRLQKFLLKETGPNDEACVFQVQINMATGTVRIQYAPDRVTLDYLRTAIANDGYDADTVKATDDSYNQLPPVCKRKEDGGGPQKGKACTIPPDGEQ